MSFFSFLSFGTSGAGGVSDTPPLRWADDESDVFFEDPGSSGTSETSKGLFFEELEIFTGVLLIFNGVLTGFNGVLFEHAALGGGDAMGAKLSSSTSDLCDKNPVLSSKLPKTARMSSSVGLNAGILAALKNTGDVEPKEPIITM